MRLGEAIALEARVAVGVAAFTVLALAAARVQGLAEELLEMALASPAEPLYVAAVIALNNAVAALVVYSGSTLVYWIAVPLEVKRCRLLYTPDCRVSLLLARRRRAAAAVSTIIPVTALLAGSSLRLGLGPGEAITAIAQAVSLGYGALEILGYLAAAASPITGGWRGPLLAISALLLIAGGAAVEALVLLPPTLRP